VISIRRRLLLWLLGPVALVALAADAVTYLKAREQLHEFVDAELRAAALGAPTGTGRRIVRVHDPATSAAAPSHEAGPPFTGRLGAETVQWQGQTWRTLTVEHEGRIVQAAELLDGRIHAAAIAIITPFSVAAVPLFAVLIWYGVGRGLRPLTRLAESIQRRAPGSLQPMGEAGLPAEILPLVRSLNDLLAQLVQVLSDERRFIADAAHGLRTPLTALRLQAENLERAADQAARATALEQLQAGILRAVHLAEQLLTMARLAPRANAPRVLAPVDLEQLLKETLIGQQALAEHRRIDLGLVRSEPISVEADGESLRIALDNLIDNALRYTPADGIVDAALYREGEHAVVEIADTGPGIPEAERSLALRRFYRGETAGSAGSGLGLAIVAEVVKQHGGRVDLAAGHDGRGLKVTLRLPLRR
jgi:signal transduction histidine kinase